MLLTDRRELLLIV